MGRGANELEEKRKKQMRLITFKRLAVVSVLSVAVIILYALRFDIASQGIGVWLQDALAIAFDNAGYPLDLEFPPQQMVAVGSRTAVVTSANVSLFNAAGNEVLHDRITFRNPLAVSRGGKLLLFSQGGRDLSIRSGAMTLYKTQTDHSIFTAALSDRGNCAYSSGAVGYQSQITVLDTRYNSIFEWGCADSVISSLSLNSAGDKLAAGGVLAQNGVVTSQILLFDLALGTQSFSAMLPDELVVGVFLQPDSTVLVITDSAVTRFSADGTPKSRYSFEGDALAAFDFSKSGGCALALGSYSTSHAIKIVRLNEQGELQATATVGREITAVDCYGEGVIAFTPDWSIHYVKSGKELVQQRLIEMPDAANATIVGEHIYYTTAQTLCRTAIGGNG